MTNGRPSGHPSSCKRKATQRQHELRVAAHDLWATAATRPGQWRQRCRPRRPYRGLRRDTGDIAQPQSADLLAQPGIGAIPGVHQHNPARQTGRPGRPDLLQRYLRLGQKSNRLGDAGRGTALGIGRPLPRQIQAPGDRQARRMSGQRQADRDPGLRRGRLWQLSCLPSWPQYCRATPTE